MVFFETAPFSTEMAILNPPEVLTFSNWALIHRKCLFFLNFAPGSIAIEPLDFGIIYKTIISFQFNQVNP
jgi:hypothetical protein